MLHGHGVAYWYVWALSISWCCMGMVLPIDVVLALSIYWCCMGMVLPIDVWVSSIYWCSFGMFAYCCCMDMEMSINCGIDKGALIIDTKGIWWGIVTKSWIKECVSYRSLEWATPNLIKGIGELPFPSQIIIKESGELPFLGVSYS